MRQVFVSGDRDGGPGPDPLPSGKGEDRYRKEGGSELMVLTWLRTHYRQ